MKKGLKWEKQLQHRDIFSIRGSSWSHYCRTNPVTHASVLFPFFADEAQRNEVTPPGDGPEQKVKMTCSISAALTGGAPGTQQKYV